ncbi:aminotransferase class III-fold pyridoxal phosphate-dependent enzyme [Micromonospora sp. NPDC049523]|uniref:aspartate aminotransferase family protein n=1 Tax=Micromonospora sp. NPDC049523 TaxID=3155921 RepID=UPI0034268183
MAPTTDEREPDPELAEAYLRGLLSTLGLDVEYVRAEGNTLYYRGGAGQEVPVVDFVGGYGSLIFGHNHPELVSYARELLDQQIPIHAQFSYHPYANQLAGALNRIIWREFGTDDRYSAIFANTGAEAVETAMKHAEMDRRIRLAELEAELDARVAAVVDAVREGSAVLTDDLADRLDGYAATTGSDVDGLVAALARYNRERLDQPPVFFTLEGSFHGKLAGSVQLTHNPGYRAPFERLAAQARFVPVDQPGAVGKLVDDERLTVLEPVLDSGVVRLAEREVPRIAGFFVEPIQGEGGIHVLGPEMAQEVRAAADAAGFPVIVDEIQSGVGRSGAFFASSLVGLRGDYYVLAKSLGGGLAKSSVLLVRADRYRTDFELLHSSTFAKDAYSCHLGMRVLRMLEAEQGRAYRLAQERGAALLAALVAVRDDFPDVVKEARGRGLMLGLEFHDLTGATGPILRENANNGLIGYLLAGYLLREHRIRIFPTASAAHTLRLEPSVELTDGEIEQLQAGLRDLCAILREQDEARLLPS